MANYSTSQDLIRDIAFRAGEPSSSTDIATGDYYDAIIRYLNRAYQGIWRGGGELLPDLAEQWYWLKSYNSGVLTLLPVFDTGTVQVTNNNTAITFSGVPTRSGGNISLLGYHFRTDEHPDVFLISAHTSGVATATLDSVYTGDDDTAATFRAFKVVYTLASDVLDLTGPMRAYQGGAAGRIEKLTESALVDAWPLEQAQAGVPLNYAFVGADTATASGVTHVQFSHYGGTTDTELMRIEYPYLYKPADLADDTAEPILPREYRKVLADWALFFVLQDKEDSRAADVLTIASQGLRQMAKENRRSGVRQGDRARIYPRLGQRGARKGPLRTEQGFLIGG